MMLPRETTTRRLEEPRLCCCLSAGFLTLSSLGVLLGFASPLAASEGDSSSASFSQSFKQGTISLGFRYRWEQVDDDAPAVADRTARASTLRTTLGFQSKSFHGWSLGLVVEDVAALGAESYNNAGVGSLANGARDRPVVADPDNTEVSQFFAVYQPTESTSLRFGRQELSLDNQRFVGPVGWRQNHQELDAFVLDSRPTQRWRLRYAYLARVHTVTGAEPGMSSHLLNLGRTFEAGTLTAYSYWLDYDDPSASALSASSTGVRFAGQRTVGAQDPDRGVLLQYELEAAQQADHGDNPSEIDLGYRKLELGATWRASAPNETGVTLRAGLEVLEGNGTVGFRTPLATLHKFNGFADKFLVTPATGLEDLYAGVELERGKLSGLLVFHHFTAEQSSADHGSEIDLQILYATSWKQTFGIKLARYDAATFASDTDKLMFWTQWGF